MSFRERLSHKAAGYSSSDDGQIGLFSSRQRGIALPRRTAKPNRSSTPQISLCLVHNG
jgi:hypothetical protein